MNHQFVLLHTFMALCLLLTAGALASWQTLPAMPTAEGQDLLTSYVEWQAQTLFYRKAYISGAWLLTNLITFFTVRRLLLDKIHYYLPLLASGLFYFLVRWLAIDRAWQGLFGHLLGPGRPVVLLTALLSLTMAALLYYSSLRERPVAPAGKEKILDSEL